MANKNDEVLNPANDLDLAKLREELAKEIKAELKKEMKAEFAKKAAEDDEKLSENEKNLEAKIAKQEKSLKQILDEMEKVDIEIPEDPNNPDDVVPVGWNGIIYAIPRGQSFKVPKVIYDIWKESDKKTKEVNKRIRESTKKEIEVL